MAKASWRNDLSPAKLARRVQRARNKIERESTGAIGRAADVLGRALRRRVYPSKQISKQDDPSRRGRKLGRRTPIEIKLETPPGESRARVAIVPYYTGARTAGIRGAYGRTGRSKDLLRAGLVVKGGRRLAGGAAGPREATRYLRFDQSPGLDAWAHREDKGKQYLRHVVRVETQDVMQALLMGPALRESEQPILAIWRNVHKAGLLA